MLKKTNGIVLGYIRYGDSSIITRIYTEDYGLQSYLVNGVRSSKAKSKISLYQPLTLLEMVVYYKENRDLKRISEVKNSFPFSSIPFDQKKVCIALFITEVLSKCLRHDHSDPELFDILKTIITKLDQEKVGYENIHLILLIELSGSLGFRSVEADELIREYPVILSPEEKNILNQALEEGINFTGKINNSQRRKIMDCLLHFYSHHVENFGTLNSVEILKEVLSG